MNVVEVDEAALAAEAMAAVAGAPAEPVQEGAESAGAEGEGGALAPAAEAQSWGPLVDGLLPPLYLFVVPQWELTPDERSELRASLTQTLDVLFPGGLEGKYAPCVRLVAVASGIALSRIVTQGKLPPMGPRRVHKAKSEAEPAAAASEAT